MKCLLLALNLLLLLLGSACQVKEASSEGNLISGHTRATNSFTLQSLPARTYVTGEVLSFEVDFPFPVLVTGTPQLSLTIGSTTRFANYVSGAGTQTLLFEYTVVVADNDSDGIVLNGLGLNGGTLNFDNKGVIVACGVATLTSRTLSQLKVDNSGPTITNFRLANLPGFFRVGQSLTFAMTFSEAVNVTGVPRFAMALDTGGSVFATYVSGSGTTVLSFKYDITNAVADMNGLNSITSPLDLNAGTIKDASGNNSDLAFSALAATALPLTASVTFDGTLPYIVSVTPPANATYNASQNLDFIVTYDRAVTVTGSPYIELTVGPPAVIRQATYLSGSGTTALKFRYTTIPGDDSPAGVTLASTITRNSSNITGTAAPTGNFFTVPLNNIYSTPVTSGVIINAPLPKVISVIRNVDATIPIFGSTTADNVWIIGQELLLTVGFNTAVYVNQTSGTPRIPLTVGAVTRYATYLSGGNGQTSLLFRYLIQESDLDTDTNIAVGAIDLNGGNITDVFNTNILTPLPVTQISSTLIDGVRPKISTIAAPANGSYSTVTGNNNTNMTFIINWSEAVSVSTTGSGSLYLPLVIGSTTNNAQYLSGTTTAATTHIPGSLLGLLDADGVALGSPAAGTALIKDRAGNLADDFSYTPPNTTGVLVDAEVPLVTLVTPPANDSYIIGENLDFSPTA